MSGERLRKSLQVESLEGSYICDVDHANLRPEQVQLEGFLPVGGQLEGQDSYRLEFLK